MHVCVNTQKISMYMYYSVSMGVYTACWRKHWEAWKREVKSRGGGRMFCFSLFFLQLPALFSCLVGLCSNFAPTFILWKLSPASSCMNVQSLRKKYLQLEYLIFLSARKMWNAAKKKPKFQRGTCKMAHSVYTYALLFQGALPNRKCSAFSSRMLPC